MENQTVVVVGGASGLGLETARLMVKRGARKIGLIDRNEQLLVEAAQALRELGAEVARLVRKHPPISIVGGCCGSDMRHMRAMAAGLAA